MAQQGRNVFLAVAQRRQGDIDDVQAVIQVLAELAFLHQLRQVGVGGGQDAHVHALRLCGSQGRELFFLDHAQQLDLRLRPQGSDLVEEDCPTVRHLEVSLLGLDRAGEGALHVAEEGGFQ